MKVYEFRTLCTYRTLVTNFGLLLNGAPGRVGINYLGKAAVYITSLTLYNIVKFKLKSLAIEKLCKNRLSQA